MSTTMLFHGSVYPVVEWLSGHSIDAEHRSRTQDRERIGLWIKRHSGRSTDPERKPLRLEVREYVGSWINIHGRRNVARFGRYRHVVGDSYKFKNTPHNSNGEVYRLADGSYVAVGCGGAKTEFAVQCGDNSIVPGSAIFIIGDDAALRRWAAAHDVKWSDKAPDWALAA